MPYVYALYQVLALKAEKSELATLKVRSLPRTTHVHAHVNTCAFVCTCVHNTCAFVCVHVCACACVIRMR